MTQTLFTILFYIVLFVVLQRLVKNWVQRLSRLKQVSETRSKLVTQYITYLLFVSVACLMIVTLGVEYQQVSLFISSIFAVLGVALVAQWSILSNITAGILIFFVFPYRIGDKIKVVDKDEDISGIITEISLFHILIERDDKVIITYPNNLMLQKGVLKLKGKPAQALSLPDQKDHTQQQSD
ncbi:mechanosensitive ion channel protein MscS [Shewanella colwelliana]|uniref:Small-conductance mechanosensitive channel n=1 Tax=Shewanella colwelliana TaxID=23 RepID=A0ABQ4NVU9_SHECO|nr:mechanosensitive ion channel family protein [Shewanella colwelliana]GIU26546.1 mechanosensitive ion channel protein MscS [Shewanella colwelliana]GIU37278.1 mechanosensitive ion channel protein MscS [Shewanella colwelliana]